MRIDTAYANAGQRRCRLIDAQGLVIGNAEFVIFQSRGNIRVGFGIDIGVHAKTHGGGLAEFGCCVADSIQFRFAFDVKTKDSGFKCGGNFPRAFPTPEYTTDDPARPA